jgi:hypothetical protein
MKRSADRYLRKTLQKKHRGRSRIIRSSLSIGLFFAVPLVLVHIASCEAKPPSLPESCSSRTQASVCVREIIVQYPSNTGRSDSADVSGAGDLLLQLSSRRLKVRLTGNVEAYLQNKVPVLPADVATQWEQEMNGGDLFLENPPAMIDIIYSKIAGAPKIRFSGGLMIDPRDTQFAQDRSLLNDPAWIRVDPAQGSIGDPRSSAGLLCHPEVLYSGSTVIGVITLADFESATGNDSRKLSDVELSLLKACFYYSIGLPSLPTPNANSIQQSLHTMHSFRLCLKETRDRSVDATLADMSDQTSLPKLGECLRRRIEEESGSE